MNISIKIISIQISIFFILFLTVEAIWGHWFGNNNFGPLLRGKRLQKIIINKNGEKINYYRDFYGFREGFESIKKYDTSKIKVIFNGGSTSDEFLLNYKDTIVGQINSYLIDDGINLKIYNAANSGKSIKGLISEFYYWFGELPNFKPEIIIYYIGLNSRKTPPANNQWMYKDYKEMNLEFIETITWNISQKSFFFEKLKIIKDRYFPKYGNYDEYVVNDKKLSFNEFISYNYAKKNYRNINKAQINILENFQIDLKILKKELDLRNIKPIFITQVNHQINGDEMLYFLNEELKKFSKKNNYTVVKLDELILSPLENSFIDTIHTNENGSKKIAKILYPHLKKELLKQGF